MTYQELLEKINNFYQKTGLKQLPSAPVIHNGFPGNFNLSLTEYEFLNQSPDFFGLKKDMVYVKNQPCIRHEDFAHIKKLNDDSYRYLLRFSMASLGGIYWEKDASKRSRRIKENLSNLFEFLTKECGLDINKFHIQYLKSDTISNLTDGKYNFNFHVPDDPNLLYYKNLGIPEKNFITVSNRNALLALNVYGRPTPWGYRNEIFYEHNGQLLDIATFENLIFQPIFNAQKEIIGLIPFNNTMVISAIGIERLLMVMNNQKDINEIDLISEPAKILRPYLDPQFAAQLVQTIRTILSIISDGGTYSNLGKRRRERMRGFFKFMQGIVENNHIPTEVLVKVMEKIAELEPNLPKLKKAISQTICKYDLHKLRMKYIHSWQEHLDELPDSHLA